MKVGMFGSKATILGQQFARLGGTAAMRQVSLLYGGRPASVRLIRTQLYDHGSLPILMFAAAMADPICVSSSFVKTSWSAGHNLQ